MKKPEDNHLGFKLIFIGLMAITAHLLYHGVRVTLFNIPFPIIVGLTVQHELSLGLWVFGSVTAIVLMVIIVDAVRPPRQKIVWDIK